MTTTYGTIPTAAPPLHPPLLSNSGQRIRSGVGTRQPWKELISSSFSLPESFNAAIHRIRTNASYFHVNYAIIVLFMLFVSLLWHPLSLILFIVSMAAWLFLYFLRDRPVVICGYGVEERLILVVLSILTVALLLTTHAVVFVAGLAVGMVAVMAHAAFRGTSDLVYDDVEAGCGERVVGLKETASDSFSASGL
ncbi:hypothetical protein CASFOL_030828 [Castilleja foliolosa]|uniref:PRA1 family protein n=1 Tax=Castilleja foliolosa TaxID=1961234 RepID=A0ABD3C7T3_9LAMI